jgi:hypothetical protein
MFVPRFCPSPACPNHNPDASRTSWYWEWGSYRTITFGEVPRYRCKRCWKTFSVQTFRLDYYGKKAVRYDRIGEGLRSSCSLRALGRAWKVRVSTVSNRIYRLARQHTVLQARKLEETRRREDLALGSFLGGGGSFPSRVHLLLGVNSGWIYQAVVGGRDRESSLQAWREAADTVSRIRKKTGVSPGLRVGGKEALGFLAGSLNGSVTGSRGGGEENPEPVRRAVKQMRLRMAWYRPGTRGPDRDVNQASARIAVYRGYRNGGPGIFASPGADSLEPGGNPCIGGRSAGFMEERLFLSHHKEWVTGRDEEFWFGRLATPGKPKAVCAEAYVPKHVAW